jgi:hypothetical protein
MVDMSALLPLGAVASYRLVMLGSIRTCQPMNTGRHSSKRLSLHQERPGACFGGREAASPRCTSFPFLKL